MIKTARGAKTYEGRPCKHGHVVRYAANHNCVACNRTQLYTADRELRLKQMKRHHSANRERHLEQMKRHHAANREHILERQRQRKIKLRDATSMQPATAA